MGELELAYLTLHEKYKTSRLLSLRKKYRSNLEIMALMIEAVKGGAGQYSIMRHVGVNHAQLKKYLGTLFDMNFVEANSKEDAVLYRATEKGLAYLRQYYVLLGMLLTACAQDRPNVLVYEAKHY
jgi:predicted transcriptional regulator